jgi:ribose transport system permease protein
VSLVAVVAAVLFEPLGAPLAISVALFVGLTVGLVNGLAVAAGLESFLVTLATLSLAQGVAFAVRPVPGGSVPRWFGEIASTWGPMPIALPIAVSVAVMAAFIFGRTKTGAHILAVGGDAEIARLSGVRVRPVLVRAYLLSALCAALAALFLLARIRTGDPLIGGAFTLNSLAAVVLGGTLLVGGRATLAGTVLGAVALGMLANLLNLTGASSFYQAPITGLLLILAVLAPVIVGRVLLRRRRKAMIEQA